MREATRVKCVPNIIQFTYVDDLTNSWNRKITFGIKINQSHFWELFYMLMIKLLFRRLLKWLKRSICCLVKLVSKYSMEILTVKTKVPDFAGTNTVRSKTIINYTTSEQIIHFQWLRFDSGNDRLLSYKSICECFDFQTILVVRFPMLSTIHISQFFLSCPSSIYCSPLISHSLCLWNMLIQVSSRHRFLHSHLCILS